MREARFDDSVGRRLQDWSSKQLGDEITAALEEFVGPERTVDDDDLQIFATWNESRQRKLRLVGELVNAHLRRWIDEPHQLLGGLTLRDAVAGADRAEVVRLLRQIENGVEGARRRGGRAWTSLDFGTSSA